jgi:DNA (cytosine-5)-methyltransferase 1
MTLGIVEAARRARVRVDVALAVDLDPAALSVYRTNFPDAVVMGHKVESLFNQILGSPLSARETVARARFGSVDIMLGGPPCQGHSDLNNHTRRRDARNGLYLRMVRAAEVLQPRVILVENVPAVVHSAEAVVETTVRALEPDYEVAHVMIRLDQLGMPQKRRRHLLLACRRGAELPSPQELLSPMMLSERDGVHTVREAIGDLSRLKPSRDFDRASSPSPENERRIEYLHTNRCYDLPNTERPACHRDKDHSYLSMHGRLHWNEPAQTITTGFRSMGQGRYVHPSKRRTLTPHEAARLQTFPDFFDFGNIGPSALARVIGNAVPPALTLRLGCVLIPHLLPTSTQVPLRRPMTVSHAQTGEGATVNGRMSAAPRVLTER